MRSKTLLTVCFLIAMASNSILLSQEPEGGAIAEKPQNGRYVNPDTIKRRDRNPDVKSEDDLWKLKYHVWHYANEGESTQRIFAALGEPTRLEFIDVPLVDAVQYLQELHNIPIKIDSRALANKDEMLITVDLKGVSLKGALTLVLDELELDFTITNEVLLITTPGLAVSTLETRVYEARLLSEMSAGELSKLIVATVAPRTWNNEGGQGTIRTISGGLVVYQTQRVHDQIIDLLRQLDAHEDSPIFK